MKVSMAFLQLIFPFVFTCVISFWNSDYAHCQPPSPQSVIHQAQGGGTDVGSGGEGALAMWKAIALNISEDLRKLKVSSLDPILFKKIQLELPQLILKAHVEFKTYPLILGKELANVDTDSELVKNITKSSCDQSTRLPNERDAINFSQSKKIKVNLNRFLCYRMEGPEIQLLILHEYLGLLGITEIENNVVQYKITNALIQDFLTLPKIDKSLEVKILKTCRELLDIGERPETNKKLREQSNHSATPRVLWRLGHDIDCAEDSTEMIIKDFQPKSLLWGSLDGAGFRIKNLTILSNSTTLGGVLFASLCSRCSITNLSLDNIKISGPATLVAENYGHISQVSVTGYLETAFATTGGLVATNSGGSIDHVAIDLKITSNSLSSNPINNNIGGLVGLNDQGKISNALVKAKITGSNTIGGVVGFADWGSIIRQSTADVSLSCNGICILGGFVGINKGIISNSKVSGKLKSILASENNKSMVGGFVGVNFAIDHAAKGSADIQATLSSCIAEVSICGAAQGDLAVGSSQVTKESGVEVLSSPLVGVEGKGSLSLICPTDP